MHLRGHGERPLLQSPDPLGREAPAARRLGDPDHRIRSQEGIGESLDLAGLGAVRQVVGDGADRVAAVEVGGVPGDRALDLPRRQDARPGSLVAETGGDPPAVEPDLLALHPPGLAQALRGQVAVLGLPSCQGCDLHRAGRGTLPGGGDDLGAAGREGPQLLGRELPDVGDALLDRLPLGPEPPGQLVP